MVRMKEKLKPHCGYGDSFAVKQFKIKTKFALANLIKIN